MLLKPLFSRSPAVTYLGLSAGKFQDDSGSGGASIESMFLKHPVSKIKTTETSGPNDSDSDVEITCKETKKGTIQSFFKQAQSDSCVTETSNLETINTDACVKENAIKKEETSISSFFRTKEIKNLKTLNSNTTGSNLNLTHNESSEKLQVGTVSETSTRYIKRKKQSIDTFFTPKRNKELYNDSKADIDVSDDCSLDSDLHICDNDTMDNNGLHLPVAEETEMDKRDKQSFFRDGDEASSLKSETDGRNVFNSNQVTSDIHKNRYVTSQCEISADKSTCDSNEYLNKDVIDVDSGPSFAPEDYLPCEKCRKPIAVWDMPEHMDFHFALDLQKDINTVPSQAMTNNTGKRKSVGADNRTSKKLKTSSSQGKLDSFFNRKT